VKGGYVNTLVYVFNHSLQKSMPVVAKLSHIALPTCT